ncbi:TIM barrel protein, partial [Staphylococcus sp. SIMBA_130]
MPGYFLSRVPQARELLAEVDRPNVGLQLDLYHAQITEGDLTRLVDASVDLTRHVQIAGVPDRHEPDTGEVAYEHLFAHLDKAGYTG